MNGFIRVNAFKMFWGGIKENILQLVTGVTGLRQDVAVHNSQALGRRKTRAGDERDQTPLIAHPEQANHARMIRVIRDLEVWIDESVEFLFDSAVQREQAS